jgi:hypothetical protein
MAAMEELGTQLQSLQALKPPGITPTKIKAITQICVDNIQVCQPPGSPTHSPRAQDVY